MYTTLQSFTLPVISWILLELLNNFLENLVENRNCAQFHDWNKRKLIYSVLPNEWYRQAGGDKLKKKNNIFSFETSFTRKSSLNSEFTSKKLYLLNQSFVSKLIKRIKKFIECFNFFIKIIPMATIYIT